MDEYKIVFSTMSLLGYLFISIGFSWYSIIPNNDHRHMNGSSCSYVLGINVLCGMNLSDYVSKWKDFYLVFSPYQNVLFFLLLGLVSVFSVVLISVTISKLIIYLKRKVDPPVLLVTLFSRGILNSKAY